MDFSVYILQLSKTAVPIGHGVFYCESYKCAPAI